MFFFGDDFRNVLFIQSRYPACVRIVCLVILDPSTPVPFKEYKRSVGLVEKVRNCEFFQ